jgi:putative tricarboxylic transport membrane protein
MGVRMKKAEIYFGSFLLFLAISMFSISLTYPYKTKFGPGPGFFPLWSSGLMIIVTLLLLYKKLRESNEAPFFTSKNSRVTVLIFLGLSIAAVALIPVLGLLLSFGLFCTITLRFIDKYSWKRSSLVSIIMMVAVYLVFELWLQLPLPKGFLQG